MAEDPVPLRAGAYQSGIAAWDASDGALQALKRDGWLGLQAGDVGRLAVLALGGPAPVLREPRLKQSVESELCKPDEVPSAARSCVAEAPVAEPVPLA